MGYLRRDFLGVEAGEREDVQPAAVLHVDEFAQGLQDGVALGGDGFVVAGAVADLGHLEVADLFEGPFLGVVAAGPVEAALVLVVVQQDVDGAAAGGLGDEFGVAEEDQGQDFALGRQAQDAADAVDVAQGVDPAAGHAQAVGHEHHVLDGGGGALDPGVVLAGVVVAVGNKERDGGQVDVTGLFGDLGLGLGVVDEDEVPELQVAGTGGVAGGVDDLGEGLRRHRVLAELAAGPAREDRLVDGHEGVEHGGRRFGWSRRRSW